MFRATSCSSSGGQILLIEHLVSSLSVSDHPVHRLFPAVTFQVQQLCTRISRVKVLVASPGQFSSRSLCHSGLPQVPFPKNFADEMERWCCASTKFKCYIKCIKSPVIFWGGGDVMHNRDADSEAA